MFERLRLVNGCRHCLRRYRLSTVEIGAFGFVDQLGSLGRLVLVQRRDVQDAVGARRVDVIGPPKRRRPTGTLFSSDHLNCRPQAVLRLLM